MSGFSFLPGNQFINNFQSAISNSTIPVINGVINSLIIATCTAILSIYFSAMTAYSIHVYDFKGKKFIFNFILLIMTIPTQVSALGFFSMCTDLGLRDTYIPLIVPAIAAPAVFFFMIQYMKSSLPIDIIEAGKNRRFGRIQNIQHDRSSYAEACSCSTGNIQLRCIMEQLLPSFVDYWYINKEDNAYHDCTASFSRLLKVWYGSGLYVHFHMQSYLLSSFISAYRNSSSPVFHSVV